MTATEFPERTWTYDRHAELPPEGPWVDEPDKMQWVDPNTGYDCLIRRGIGGGLCGYVGVPEGHPLFGVFFQDVQGQFDVHNDLSYSAPCNPEVSGEGDAVCHVPYPGRPDNVWWFGFHCAGAWDFEPAHEWRWMRDLPGHQANFTEGLGVYGQSYKPLAYVKAQVQLLALQLQLRSLTDPVARGNRA